MFHISMRSRFKQFKSSKKENESGFADYVADDLLMPAEEYTSDAVKAKIIPSFWESNAIDGTVWALPIPAYCRSLFCNMDLLSEAGVTAPPHHLGRGSHRLPGCEG